MTVPRQQSNTAYAYITLIPVNDAPVILFRYSGCRYRIDFL